MSDEETRAKLRVLYGGKEEEEADDKTGVSSAAQRTIDTLKTIMAEKPEAFEDALLILAGGKMVVLPQANFESIIGRLEATKMMLALQVMTGVSPPPEGA